MANIMSPVAKRQLVLGERVDKAIVTLGGSTKSLFTIAGGRILVTSLVGRVTVAIGATTSNLKLVYNPTAAGTSFDLCVAVDIASDAVENTYALSPVGTVGSPGNLIVAGTVGQAQPILQSPWLLQAGEIEANFSADPTGSGAISWSVTYIPYDDAATLVAS